MTDDANKSEEEPKDEPAAEQPESAEVESEKTGEAETSSNSADAKDADPLPEIEERTPEYVEEEAQRGDFVLRWAIVLLALMLGFTQTDDSKVLLHAKSGEYMQSNGFLPPRVDVFSYTAEGQPWVQTSWLFDHVSALFYSVMGETGFTILTALLAAIAFGYAVHIALPGVSTWWTVICVAFALLTCFPRFTATPDLLTLVFLAITLSWMYRWQTSEGTDFPWRIPILFVVWANCDPRMWIGVLCVGLYAIGHAIDRLIGRNGWMLPARSKQVWMLFAACVVAALANPFLHESLMEPIRQYGSEYPAMRSYTNLREATAPAAPEWALQPYGLFKPEVWMSKQKTIIAGAVILLLSIILFIVNFKHTDIGYFMVLLGFVTLVALACHELAAAALVAAVLAGLNGQDWYRHNFRTDYTTDVKTFVFSQGGRALTVIGLFGFAFLGVSGRLTGPDGVRIGTKFDPNLNATIDGVRSSLEGIDTDNRVFNFRQSQGDVLIWLGYKSFVDSRYALFGTAEDSISATHRATRVALRSQQAGRTSKPGAGDTKVWQKTVKDYEIDYVAPSLYGRSPDYVTYFDLQRSPRWALQKLGNAMAVFKPVKLGDAPDEVDFRKLGLQTQVKEPPTRLDWARPPGFYDEFVFIPKNLRRSASQMAQHYRRHLANLPRERPEQILGAAYLTLRSATEALSIDPNDARAYRAMGDAYSMIMNIEVGYSQQFGGTSPSRLRGRQAIAAYRQSLRADPQQADLMFDLSKIYREQGKAELCVQMMDMGLAIVDTGEDLTEEQARPIETVSRQRNAFREQIARAIEQAGKMREQYQQQNKTPLGQTPDPRKQAADLLQFCAQIVDPRMGGLTLHAQQVLEDGLAAVQGAPQVTLAYAQLLMDNGELEDASNAFQQLAELDKQRPEATKDLNWQSDAATIAMIEGNYQRARDIWGVQFEKLRDATEDESVDQEKMQHLPLLGFPDTWPARQVATLQPLLVDAPGLAADVRFNMAISLIEEGRVRTGAELMKQLINSAPAASITPLARYYYKLIEDKDITHTFDAGYMPLDLDAVEEEAKEGDKAAGEAAAKPNEGDPAAEDGKTAKEGDKE